MDKPFGSVLLDGRCTVVGRSSPCARDVEVPRGAITRCWPESRRRSYPSNIMDGKPDLSGVWGPASFGPGPNHDPRQTNPDDRRKNLEESRLVY